MENPKVTIIIPCYNVEKYVEECLDSIISQTYKNLEIICINDGSTDGTLDILEKFKKSYPDIIVVHQINRGLSEARNAGIRLATGAYVMFIDSDDFIEPDTVEKGIKAFSNYRDIDCINFGMRAFVEENGVDIDKVKELNEWLSNKWSGFLSFDFDKAYHTNANVCNKMYKLSDIKGKIEFIPDTYYEDIYFCWIMFFKTRIMRYEPGIQYHYRIRKNSIMTNTEKGKNFNKAMHHFYNWDKLVRDISYDKDIILKHTDNLLRLLKKYAWWVAYYSPEDMKDIVEKEHNNRIEWLTEIYNNYKLLEKGE